jgi:hypothetical protein
VIAERCFAALGDISKAKYLKKVNELAEQAAVDMVSFKDGFTKTILLSRVKKDHWFQKILKDNCKNL